MSLLKQCTVCKEQKNITDYGKYSDGADGLLSRCRPCESRRKYNWVKSKGQEYQDRKKENYQKNKPKIQEYKKQHSKINFESIKKYKAEYYEKNKKVIQAKKNKYREENKKQIAAKKSIYKKENSHKVNALNAKRRATKINATPSWLTKAHYAEIADFYKQAKELEAIFFNRKFQVDHIIPLLGKNVCGLHVPWNLQILTAKENLQKNNKFEQI